MLGLSLCQLLLATCAETTVSKMGASPSDAAPLPECAIPRATENIAIDGDLAEDAWAATPVIDQFSFPWRTQGAKDRTEARLHWDDGHLYVGFTAFAPHISAVLTERDSPVSRIAIHFAAFKGYASNLPPQPGDVWRLNLYRTGGTVTSSISPGPTPKSPNPNSTRPNALASRASSTRRRIPDRLRSHEP